MKKRVLATLLSLTMLAATLTACGDSSAPASSGTPNAEADAAGDEADAAGDAASTTDGDPVKLEVLIVPGYTGDNAQGWLDDYFRERVNVEVECLVTGEQAEQKLQALMASGDLPDIIVFKDDKQVINAVTGDMLLAYDDYKDLVPNLYNNAGISMRYYADNISNGQGKSYAVGIGLVNEVEKYSDNAGCSIRYDYYKELGSPEIKHIEDWLPVLKQMQEAHPTNDDGKKTYGISLFKEWDRAYMTIGMFFAPLVGVNIQGEANLAQVDYTNNEEVSSILGEDSAYMRFLRFMFEANQMGLVDPDSMTQRFSDYTAKVADGRILWGIADWGTSFPLEQQEQGIGFRRVLATEDKCLVGDKQMIGKGWSISVSKNTKHPEEAMKYINLLYDYETAMVEQDGPKGVCWDLDENGKPYVTEEGYKWYADADKMNDKGHVIARPYELQCWNKELNCPNLYTQWENKPDYAPADTKLVAEWKQDIGHEWLLQQAYDLGNVIVKPFVTIPTLTDEMETISSRVGDVIKTQSWKMIFAKDQAEFDALYKEMVEKAEGMGINEYVDWYRDEYEKGAEFAKQYTE